MISTGQLIKDLSLLGKAFGRASGEPGTIVQDQDKSQEIFQEAVEQAYLYNPWFIPSFVRFGFSAWAGALQEEKLARWIDNYDLEEDRRKEPATIGIIMAGNIPMVGFHDLVSVLASGNRALVKLSSSDDILIPAVLEVLCTLNPEYRDLVIFADGPLKKFDAIIATGSNNSSRYFDYYFGKYPHIIRKNRNSAAVLDGKESAGDLLKLADDIFLYFGLGCRNVSKIYVPEGYDPGLIYQAAERYTFMADHNKYRNNYDYQKSILLINRIAHYDNGFLLVKPDTSLISPISVIHLESYQTIEQLNIDLQDRKDELQCIVSASRDVEFSILPGTGQFPELWDYADGIDTMEFLMNL